MNRSSAVVRFALRATVIALFLCTFSASSAHADRWMVPAVANVAGNAGTNWRTDLRLVNTEDSPVTVRVYLLPADADNSALDRFIDVEVPADGQVQLDNIVGDRFGFSGTGALLVDAPGDDLIVASRTYNLVPGGTYGQFIPGVPVDQSLTPGNFSYLAYLAKSGDFRTNFGWAATGTTAGSIEVTLYDIAGTQLGSTKSYSVLPYGQRQINDIFTAVGAPPADAAYAVVRATVPVVAYASVV